MKWNMRSAIALILTIGPIAAAQAAQTHVDGYTRRDGTYVAPHFRTTPDSSLTNNWSSQPNVNPYTGTPGTVNPYAPQLPRTPTYENPYAPRR